MQGEVNTIKLMVGFENLMHWPNCKDYYNFFHIKVSYNVYMYNIGFESILKGGGAELSESLTIDKQKRKREKKIILFSD